MTKERIGSTAFNQKHKINAFSFSSLILNILSRIADLKIEDWETE